MDGNERCQIGKQRFHELTLTSERPYSLGARWIHTMLASPVENQWINVADGKVESISAKPAYVPTISLGETTILPAAVNAHAHLELSQLTAPLDVPSRSMSDWVEALIAFRRSTDYDAEKGIQRALQWLKQHPSTIAVADIALPTVSLQSPVTCLLQFTELIAWRSDLVEENFSSLSKTFGLSPHAPHTVCPALLEKVIAQNVPIAMHLAETPEELQLLRHHSGPLLDMMRRADADYDPKSVLIGTRPMDYLQLKIETRERTMKTKIVLGE
jgi:cytosine/adenosine deaminase-related metal-dependent hydrolase